MTPHQLQLLDQMSDPTTMTNRATPARREAVRAILKEWATLAGKCEALLAVWDAFYADEGSMNPLDYPIDKVIHEIRDAVEQANGGTKP